MIRVIICRIDSNGHDTARPKHEGAGDFREVFFGRLVRTGKRLDLITRFCH
jgi:hypothetical protein